MKSLKQLLEASLLDLDTNFDVTDADMIKDTITKFINDNYNCKKFTISKNPNKDGKFEVSTKYDVEVKNKSITSLTNDLFVWSKIGSYFSCKNCKNLQSLEGSPKEVKNGFYCSNCSSLQSLEGSPKEVKNGFYCSNCSSLKSLEGCPEKVGGGFYCSDCISLKSLKDAPKEVGGGFYCYNCKSLQSLEGAPKEVGGDFDCYYCEVQFKESDIRNICDIKGKIIV